MVNLGNFDPSKAATNINITSGQGTVINTGNQNIVSFKRSTEGTKNQKTIKEETDEYDKADKQKIKDDTKAFEDSLKSGKKTNAWAAAKNRSLAEYATGHSGKFSRENSIKNQFIKNQESGKIEDIKGYFAGDEKVPELDTVPADDAAKWLNSDDNKKLIQDLGLTDIKVNGNEIWAKNADGEDVRVELGKNDKGKDTIRMSRNDEYGNEDVADVTLRENSGLKTGNEKISEEMKEKGFSKLGEFDRTNGNSTQIEGYDKAVGQESAEAFLSNSDNSKLLKELGINGKLEKAEGGALKDEQGNYYKMVQNDKGETILIKSAKNDKGGSTVSMYQVDYSPSDPSKTKNKDPLQSTGQTRQPDPSDTSV